MGDYYARDGQPLELMEWSRLHSDQAYKRVAETTIGAYWVSTVWLGLNHNWDDQGPPLIFETMVFPADGGSALDLYSDRYSTEAQALAGHEEMCTLIRATAQDLPE